MRLLQPLESASPLRFKVVEVAAPTTGRALLNFGAGTNEARVVVTGQAGISAQSVVSAWRLIAASADHTADEHAVEDLDVLAGYIVPGTGFTIVGRPRMGRLFGAFNVAWSWS